MDLHYHNKEVLLHLFVQSIATPDQDYLVTATRVNFSRTDQLNTFSDRPLSIQIFDDEITEPRESLVCLFLAPEVDAIRAITPVRATIVIEDNDG